MKDKIIAIANAKIFDGERVIEGHNVIIEGEKILNVGGPIPESAEIIDAKGATLMPGLIDSHVHTDMNGLRDALLFGVTTELEMNGRWSAKQRKEIAERKDIADLRSPGMGVTAKGGHPTQYMSSSSNLFIRLFFRYPSVSTPEEAVKFVARQVIRGADYIKIFIEDGTCIGFPGLPVLDNETLLAAVNEAHRLDKMAIAHVTTLEGAKRAIAAGADGLAHLFFDQKPTPEFISAMTASGAFIVPTLVTISSALGNNAAKLAADKRVNSKLSKKWLDSLSRSVNVYPQGKLEDAFNGVLELYKAGVDILAGCDVSEPIPILGGLAHGASLHHELKLLVKAGLSPIEALRSATSVPARRFGLIDRGLIMNGTRADLLLVKGDPTTNISDTLSIEAVWRQGVQLASNDEVLCTFNKQDILLFEAIQNGNIGEIKTCLNNGANVNIFCDQYGVYKNISPLEYAIYCNVNADVITCLIDHGAKVDEVNDDRKRSILEIVICFYKDNEIVNYLLRNGAQFATEQHRCAFEGNIKGLQDIQQDIRENKIKTASGCTLLHYAVASGRLITVQWLLKEVGAKVDETDAFGLTALSCAASKGHIEIVKWLLEEGGSKIDERTRRGLTVLLCAANKGHLEVVKWLLEVGGAKIDEKDSEGNTALLFAAMNGNIKTVQWLLEHGASLQERNEQGKTAVELISGELNKKYLLQFNLKPKN